MQLLLLLPLLALLLLPALLALTQQLLQLSDRRCRVSACSRW